MATNQLCYLEKLNAFSGICTIKVKVLLLWKQYYNSPTPTKSSTINMILIDEKGKQIYAIMDHTVIPKFENQLKEGATKFISNFDLTTTNGTFLLANHIAKIEFKEETTVSDCEDFNDVVNCYSFCSFDSIINSNVHKNASFDVIGQVISNKASKIVHTRNGQSQILECILQDLSGQKVACALWGEHANKFTSYVSATKDANEPVIILIHLAKFNDWGKKPQVSNCLFGSKVYLNDDIPAITEFKNSTVIYTNPEDTYLPYEYKTISQLSILRKISTSVTVAKIIGLQMDKGWYYLACQKCNRRVEKKVKTNSSSSEDAFYYDCGKCPQVADVYHRIRLHVVVKDDTGTMVLCIFDKQVTDLVRRSSQFLLSKIKNENDTETYPYELDALINKEYVFKVDVSLFNIKMNYNILTAQRVTDDVAVINKVLGEFDSKKIVINTQQQNKDHEEKKVISLVDDVDNDNNLSPSKSVKRSLEHKDGNENVDSSGNNEYNSKKPKIEKD